MLIDSIPERIEITMLHTDMQVMLSWVYACMIL
jgi:hypothetical protein